MPKVREGYRQLATQIPAETMERFEVLARANNRTFSEELAHAMNRHLEAPPVVRVTVPPLAPAEIDPPPAKPASKRRKPSA
jgi:hypothetical protein